MTQPRKPSGKRIAKALEAFSPTIESFVRTVLSNGSRAGNEWQIGDLENSPGKSCSINLESGCFFDFNPAAVPLKGGPLDLFGAIFGLTDQADIAAAIDAWVKDGTLPDGRKGSPRPGELKTETGEVIIARDKVEKEWLHNIETFQVWTNFSRNLKEWHRTFPPKPTSWHGGIPLPGAEPDRYGMYRATDIDWDAQAKEDIKRYAERIAAIKSALYSRRWSKLVDETNADRDGIANALAEYRGLSPDVFTWLIESGYIAVYASEKTSRGGCTFSDVEIAFPVDRIRNWLDVDCEECDTEFFGMHLKWFGTERQGWRYEPKGIPSEPLVIGDLKSAVDVIIGESTWDIIAAIDVNDCFRWTTPWAALATRGASNAHRIPVDRIKPEAALVVVLQNDPGNEGWCRNLPGEIFTRARRWIPPEGIKDLNDWIKASGRDAVKKELNLT